MAQKKAQKSKDASTKIRSHLPFCMDGYTKGENSLPKPYNIPTVRFIDISSPDNSLVCQATELLKLDHFRNPMLIFGQPFSGKTCLFMKLFLEGKACYGPKHWMHIIDLRTTVLHCLSSKKWPTDIMEFLAEPLNMSQNALRKRFQPLGNVKEILRKKKYEKLVSGELFLDGFDEIPIAEREYFLKLLPQLKSSRHNCPIRVWINCRSYFRERVLEVMGNESAFEMLDYTPELQRHTLYIRWKDRLFPKEVKKYEEERLKEYTGVMYHEFCKDIKHFSSTIGTCPLFLEVISSVFLNHANDFMLLYRKVRQDVLAGASGHDNSAESPPKGSGGVAGNSKKKKRKSKKERKAAVDEDSCDVVTAPTVQIMCQLKGMLPGELLEYLINHAIDIYCLKYHDWRNMSEKEYQDLLETEHREAIQLYAKYSITTFPSYQHEALVSSADNPSVLKHNLKYIVGEKLHHMGLLVVNGKNCLVQYQSKSIGDYFIAKHFTNSKDMKLKDVQFDTFFLRALLFETEAKPARSFFDSILQFGTRIGEYRPDILHDFLSQQYKLEPEDEDQWEQIRNDGTVWHLAVMEGFHRTAMIMLQCFHPSTEREKIRKILRIKVPIEVHQGERISSKISRVDGGGHNQRHLVSSMSLIAMFGYSVGMEELLKTMVAFFTAEEIMEEYATPGSWTPMHYAAMHSNLWFMMYMYNEGFKKIQPPPGIYNPLGQLPSHLLMSYSWYHIMILKDHFHPDYDTLDEWQFTTNKGSTVNKLSQEKDAIPCSCQQKNSNSRPSSSGDDDDDHEDIGKCDCKNKIVHNHFREIASYRNMIKEIRGHGIDILLRLTHHECIRLVIKIGREDINAVELKTGNTMLHYAAKQGCLDTIKYLLGMGALVDPTNADGMTPVHFAGKYGHRYVFMYLVQNYGAGATLKDNQGQSAITMWMLYGSHIDKQKNEPMLQEETMFFELFMQAERIREANEIAQLKRDQEEMVKREEIRSKRAREEDNDDGEEDDDEGEAEESDVDESSSSSDEEDDIDDYDGVVKVDDDEESDSSILPYNIDDYEDYHNKQEEV